MGQHPILIAIENGCPDILSSLTAPSEGRVRRNKKIGASAVLFHLIPWVTLSIRGSKSGATAIVLPNCKMTLLLSTRDGYVIVDKDAIADGRQAILA
jgi:hypothetical protein